MTYNIGEAASCLMVGEDELLDILDVFFNETRDSLGECEQALKTGNCEALKKLFHGMKGSASNFRMGVLSELAADMESGAKSGELENIRNYLPVFRKEFESILEHIYSLKE